MNIYNKLVRDKIPEIIEEDNKIPKVRILGDEDYKLELLKKLIEEATEAVEAKDNEADLIKELGDLMEVIDSIIKAFNLNQEEIIAFKNKRKLERGGFDKQIFLESVK